MSVVPRLGNPAASTDISGNRDAGGSRATLRNPAAGLLFRAAHSGWHRLYICGGQGFSIFAESLALNRDSCKAGAQEGFMDEWVNEYVDATAGGFARRWSVAHRRNSRTMWTWECDSWFTWRRVGGACGTQARAGNLEAQRGPELLCAPLGPPAGGAIGKYGDGKLWPTVGKKGRGKSVLVSSLTDVLIPREKKESFSESLALLCPTALLEACAFLTR